ncbi:3-ketoacyl-ACP reductase [Roseomonas alkaliterrae]|uniref:NAD(P)-dependent dehydrogenase (Short-subunit alcohol dehydrogenase family) n=1 Tax=Neoroseomonas alkaliterrae TaxID=1452450 RepID=A0A840Y3T1_9PROT|nr:NAD(P)-dependent dehydrogenase (short-subunit alcohol dehydrogenase family) [Neoroseomonas alkaliterrae]MBR0677380.1 3-ketoacyl-ACP reductase [Neoroseomonas alkaliterrae]
MRPAALVTGARRGIGRAACVALAGKGFDIVGADISEEGAAETRAGVEAAGRDFVFVKADIADVAAHAALLDRAWSAFGGLECLANVAGVQVAVRQDMLETTPESWDRLLDVNARGTFFLSQAVAKRMIAPGAPARGHRSMCFVSSVNSVMASLNRAEYCVSKAGVTMIARLFAFRLADHGINTYDIQPGVIRTEMTRNVWDSYGAQLEAGLALIKRWGEAEDIGRAIATLASGAMPYSTGHSFPIDGGMLMPRF